MAHSLVIAKAQYDGVAKVIFHGSQGELHEYIDADDAYTGEQISVLARQDNGILRLVDSTVIDLAGAAPAGNHDVWIEVEGAMEQTLPGAATISAEQPSDGIWIEPEE